MIHVHARIIYWILFFFLFAVSLSLYAEKNLADVQKEIKTVQKDLAEQQTVRSNLQKKLKLSEEYNSKLKSQNQKTKTALQTQVTQLKMLEEKQAQNEIKLKAQQAEIGEQIRAAYLSGNNEFLKILLGPENIADVQKNLAYYRYFLQKRLDLVDELNQTVNELKQNAEKIQESMGTLTSLQKQQQMEIDKLQDVQLQRNQLLEKIDTTIVSKSEQLATLEQNRKALENVVVELKAKSKSAEPERHYAVNGSFAKNKGQMKLPTQGKIIGGFDSHIEGSDLKLNGILISAPQGEKVHAIAPGRVVFSQWMSGYGLLMIVDHGDGYMTLYGRNDVVYRKVGDKVSSGDVLATVGTSGGYDKPALYFAIRSDGKPLNPTVWCRA